MPEHAINEQYNDDFSYRFPMLHSEVHILRKDVDALKNNVSELKHEVAAVKSEVTELKSDVRILQNNVSDLKSDIRDLHSEVNNLNGDVRTLGTRLDGMDRRIDDIHQSQNKWFMLLGFLIAAVPIAIAPSSSVALPLRNFSLGSVFPASILCSV